MQVRVRHEIHCRFDSPTRNLVAILRLCPRSHEGQHVTDWWIDADLDCNLKSGYDEFGNVTHTFGASGQIREVTIAAAGLIDTFDTAGVVRATAERLPVEIYLRDTMLTASSAEIRDFVGRATGAEASELGKLHALMDELHGALAFDSGGTAERAADAFGAKAGGRGSHAHVFIAGARLLGIPCRYVSGYLVRSESGDATCHAWAEAYVQNLGWVGFDPVNNLCPQGEHLRCAIGFDAVNAAFLRGVPPEATTHVLRVSGLR